MGLSSVPKATLPGAVNQMAERKTLQITTRIPSG
jgi:hypothetical protein